MRRLIIGNFRFSADDYIKAPDSFRDHVGNAASSFAEDETPVKVRTAGRKGTRWLLAAAAALFILIGGGTVYAYSGGLGRWLDSIGINRKNAEKYIESGEDLEAEGSISVKEYYIDGQSLVFTAEMPDDIGREGYIPSDHAFVAGADCLLDTFDPVSDAVYEGRIVLSDEVRSAPLPSDAEVVLSFFKKSETGDNISKDYSFYIDSANISLTREIDGEEILLLNEDNITGYVDPYVVISPSKLVIRLTFTFEGDSAKERAWEYMADHNEEGSFASWYNYIDDNGDSLDGSTCNGSLYFENENISEEGYSITEVIELTDYDTSNKQITLIPYTVDLYRDGDLEGKMIPGTEKYHYDRQFTVSLE